MGGLFGAWLARGGAEVSLIDVSRPAVQAIAAEGLTITERDGTRMTLRLPVTDRPETVGTVDLLIVFVKSYHTEAAIAGAAPLIGPETAVLTLQNGWGHAQRLSGLVGAERVLVGLTYHSATLEGPGRIRHPAHGATLIGELDGRITPRLERIAAAFAAAGFAPEASPRIVGEVWKKLSLNCCALPTAALLGCFAHELVAMPPARGLVAAILAEVVAVARAKGIPLDLAERTEAVTGVLTRAVGVKPSMLQDVEARRQTEIDVINGAIAAAGRETGVPTPVNDTLVALVQALESRYAAPAPA